MWFCCSSCCVFLLLTPHCGASEIYFTHNEPKKRKNYRRLYLVWWQMLDGLRSSTTVLIKDDLLWFLLNTLWTLNTLVGVDLERLVEFPFVFSFCVLLVSSCCHPFNTFTDRRVLCSPLSASYEDFENEKWEGPHGALPHRACFAIVFFMDHWLFVLKAKF